LFDLVRDLVLIIQFDGAKSLPRKKQKYTNISLTNEFSPNILDVNHVVSAQKRGLPGLGEIAGVPHYLPVFFWVVDRMAQGKIVTVQIFDHTYQLTSDDQDPQYIDRAAQYLDDKMRQTAAAVGQRAPLDIAILAAMEIAEEVLDARRKKDSLLDETDQRIDTFARRLEGQRNSSPPTRSSRF
jgi:cell division protein ZapA